MISRISPALVFMLIWIWALQPEALAVEPVSDGPLCLSQAVEIAVANNPAVIELAETRKAAAEEVKSARADFFPKAALTYSYTSLDETPYMKGLGQKLNVSHTDVFHWDMSLSQPLFTGFGLTSRYRLSKLADESAEAEKTLAVHSIVQQVTTAYFNVLKAEKFLQVAELAVDNLKSHEQDALKFYQQGLIPYNDLLRSRVALADTVQNREKASATANLAVSALNTLLNMDLNRATEVEDIDCLPQLDPDLNQLIETAMIHRPELRRLHYAIDESDAGIGLAQSSYYPTVALVGRYEQNGKNPEASINDYSNRYNSSVTLQAQWTFFEWGKTRADVSARRHRKQSVTHQLNDAENQIRLQTQSALLTLQVAEKNIRTAKSSLSQAEENWRITNLQYRQQVATSTDVLDARTLLTQAQTNHYSALYGYMTALGDLERAVGKKLY